MPQALIESILPLITVAAGMLVAVYLFVTLKRDIHRLSTERKADGERTMEMIQTLQARVSELERDFGSLSGSAVPVQVPTAGMNLSRRTQALRLIRHGEGPEHVAAALGLPRKEVELLIKMNHIVNDRVDPVTS